MNVLVAFKLDHKHNAVNKNGVTGDIFDDYLLLDISRLRELDNLRAQRIVTDSPQLSSSKRPSEPRSSQAKNNPRRLQIKKSEDPSAKRGLNMDERVSSRATKGKAAERLLETME